MKTIKNKVEEPIYVDKNTNMYKKLFEKFKRFEESLTDRMTQDGHTIVTKW